MNTGTVSTATDARGNTLFLTLDGTFDTGEMEEVSTAARAAIAGAHSAIHRCMRYLDVHVPARFGRCRKPAPSPAAAVLLYENGMDRLVAIVGSSRASRTEVGHISNGAPFDAVAVASADTAQQLLGR